MPDLYGLAANGGVLLLISEHDAQSCAYTVASDIERDPNATAYSYTQTFRGVTETITITADGQVTSNNRNSQARPCRGTLWPDLTPASNYIGLTSFSDAGFTFNSTIGGAIAACGASAQREIDSDGIAITNPIVW